MRKKTFKKLKFAFAFLSVCCFAFLIPLHTSAAGYTEYFSVLYAHNAGAANVTVTSEAASDCYNPETIGLTIPFDVDRWVNVYSSQQAGVWSTIITFDGGFEDATGFTFSYIVPAASSASAGDPLITPGGASYTVNSSQLGTTGLYYNTVTVAGENLDFATVTIQVDVQSNLNVFYSGYSIPCSLLAVYFDLSSTDVLLDSLNDTTTNVYLAIEEQSPEMEAALEGFNGTVEQEKTQIDDMIDFGNSVAPPLEESQTDDLLGILDQGSDRFNTGFQQVSGWMNGFFDWEFWTLAFPFFGAAVVVSRVVFG